MRIKTLFFAAAIMLALTFISSLPALACEPGDPDVLRCGNWRTPRPKTVTPKTVVATVAKPTATPAQVASALKGEGPDDGLEPNDTWKVIGAGASVWFRIGGGINPQRLEVWLDAYGREGIVFEVYAPEQYNQISTGVAPKGRGTLNKTDNRHDLNWVGQSPSGGTWYVKVTNRNSIPIDYKVGYNRMEMPRKSCDSYWETIGGAPAYWTLCN